MDLVGHKEILHTSESTICPNCGKDKWPLSAFSDSGLWILCDCGTVFMPQFDKVTRFHGNLIVPERWHTFVLSRSKP